VHLCLAKTHENLTRHDDVCLCGIAHYARDSAAGKKCPGELSLREICEIRSVKNSISGLPVQYPFRLARSSPLPDGSSALRPFAPLDSALERRSPPHGPARSHGTRSVGAILILVDVDSGEIDDGRRTHHDRGRAC
jgi:hypothetical protein